jgi:hypothetical protein
VQAGSQGLARLRLERLHFGAHSFRVKGTNAGLVETVPAIRNFKVVAR